MRVEAIRYYELAPSDVGAVKEFLASPHMQDVIKSVNAMSTAPLEVIWLDQLSP